MYKASDVILKWPKKQKNPKMHFLLFFSVIKIAKDYLGESIQQFNTFGTESVYLVRQNLHRLFSTVKPPWAWEVDKRRMDPELFPSPVKVNELWVQDSLKNRKTSSLPVSPKAPSSSLFFSYPTGQAHSAKHAPPFTQDSSHRRPTTGQGSNSYK